MRRQGAAPALSPNIDAAVVAVFGAAQRQHARKHEHGKQQRHDDVEANEHADLDKRGHVIGNHENRGATRGDGGGGHGDAQFGQRLFDFAVPENASNRKQNR